MRKREGAGAAVEVKLQSAVGDVEALARSFDAVFVAPGLGMQDPGIQGSDLRGVTTAFEFLDRCRRTKYATPVGSEVVVIGGGNVAVDAAMAVVRCGEVRDKERPQVSILYRRSREEMPAWDREVREAESVGVHLQVLVMPLAFEGEKGRLKEVRLCRATLGPEDVSGRRSPVPVPGSEFVLPCDMAILATGMSLDRRPLGKLPITRLGLIKTERGTRKVRANIFAGGDVANADQTIVAAVRDGKVAAGAIADFLAAGKESR